MISFLCRASSSDVGSGLGVRVRAIGPVFPERPKGENSIRYRDWLEIKTEKPRFVEYLRKIKEGYRFCQGCGQWVRYRYGLMEPCECSGSRCDSLRDFEGKSRDFCRSKRKRLVKPKTLNVGRDVSMRALKKEAERHGFYADVRQYLGLKPRLRGQCFIWRIPCLCCKGEQFVEEQLCERCHGTGLRFIVNSEAGFELRDEAGYWSLVRVWEREKTRICQARQLLPCFWCSCKYHLYLSANESTGNVIFNFPDLDVDQIPETCALDVAERGGDLSLDYLGDLMNLTRERVNQISKEGMSRIAYWHKKFIRTLLESCNE